MVFGLLLTKLYSVFCYFHFSQPSKTRKKVWIKNEVVHKLHPHRMLMYLYLDMDKVSCRLKLIHCILDTGLLLSLKKGHERCYERRLLSKHVISLIRRVVSHGDNYKL